MSGTVYSTRYLVGHSTRIRVRIYTSKTHTHTHTHNFINLNLLEECVFFNGIRWYDVQYWIRFSSFWFQICQKELYCPCSCWFTWHVLLCKWIGDNSNERFVNIRCISPKGLLRVSSHVQCAICDWRLLANYVPAFVVADSGQISTLI